MFSRLVNLSIGFIVPELFFTADPDLNSVQSKIRPRFILDEKKK